MRSPQCISLRQNSETVIKEYLIAAAQLDFAAVRFFLEQVGLHPDSTYNGKPTALCYAALQRDHCLMMYLVKKGANVNTVDPLGSTPLHYAALSGCEYCVSYLIRSGSDLNIRNKRGETPLSVTQGRACLEGCRELLRRHGACSAGGKQQKPCFH